MAYKFELAPAAMNIREREYVTAANIRFSMFTSCIGVIAKKGPMLTAVHLVMVAPDQQRTLFNRVTASRIIHEILPNEYDCVKIIGCISLWTNPANNVLGAFNTLRGQLRSLEQVEQYQLGAGIYGANVDGDDIELTY